MNYQLPYKLILFLFNLARNKNGNSLTCNCDSDDDEDCLTVKIPEEEQILKMSCMKLSRTKASFPLFNCSLGYREQINQLSSYLDGTQIYGIDERRANALRSFQNGQIKRFFSIFMKRVINILKLKDF